MKTKTISIAAALMLAACTPAAFEPVQIETEECNLKIDFSSDHTKAVGQTEAMEKKVNNVTVFVFRVDQDNKLDASAYFTDASTAVELKCTVGQRKIYVLVNAPSDITGSVRSEADLLAYRSLLADNSGSNFFMSGDTSKSLEGGECKVDIEVRRRVASVRLEKVINNMSVKANQGNGSFVVNAVYLTNVVGSWALDGSVKPKTLEESSWLARLQKENLAPICDDGLDVTVNYGKSMDVVHTFYAFPNDCEVNESATWSQRSTMLVVEATLNGEKYYYPVAVGPLKENTQYIINNFTICRPGTKHPWEMVHMADVSLQIDIKNWDKSDLGDEVI